MNHYLIHIPSWIKRSMTQHGYNLNAAIKRFKHQHGILKMPNGYTIIKLKK